jgi:hypothetical protein
MSSTNNSVKEDFLDEDAEIPGQRFSLLSFLSPEKVLARKDLFLFEQFLKNYEITWKTKNLEKFLAKQVMDFNAKLDAESTRLGDLDLKDASELCRQARIPVDTVLNSYHEFVKENSKELTLTTIKESYDDYMFSHGKKLEDEFYSKNNFQTTVRGLKIRGNYSTQEEAAARAKKLQRNDPVHNIYVATVGKWLAWDPSPNDIADQEYAEDELNMLMKSYKENEEQREQFYKENPGAKKGGKAGVRTEKEIMSVVGPVNETVAGVNADATAAGVAAVTESSHGGLFTSDDLFLQRKMKNATVSENKNED